MPLLNDVNENLEMVNEAGVDWAAVKKAAIDAAKDIHGKADTKIIDSMIAKVKSGGEAEDTEDGIQIVINMMRSGG